jgi:hypothetical protein
MTTEGVIAPPGARELWMDDENRSEVWFDSESHVIAFHQRAGYGRLRPSLWERLLQLVGL